MDTPLAHWSLAALLLLVAAALPRRGDADSPAWADEHMLVLWPEALCGTDGSSAEAGSATTATGLVTLSYEPIPPAEQAQRLPAPALAVDSPFSSLGSERLLPPLVAPLLCDSCEGWQILPAGILYRSYIAGEKEPRMAAAYLYEKDRGSIFEGTIGGRLGFLRYGTPGPINPQGFQWDLEGAALLRQDIEQELDVEAVDFRVGTVVTWRRGPTAAKFGYYHLSSHVGDEFLLRNPLFPRLNYVRDALLIGVHHDVRDDLAIYGEIAYSLKADGGAEPLELQFGMEYVPWNATRLRGAPVLAVNGHLREEFNFGGSVNVIAGWEWRGLDSDRRLRIGGQFYNGKEIQWSFFDESVTLMGLGIWYDF